MNHKVTTPNGTVLHGKHISTPIADFSQEHNNRENGPRGPNCRFTKSQSKQKQATVIESDSEPDTPLLDIDLKTSVPLDKTTLKKAHSAEPGSG